MSFMWIRDNASVHVSGLRAIIYGYSSRRLVDSTTRQSIRNIAKGFIEHFRLGSWNLASSRPLVFLDHSLGGLVLKDALVQIAEATDSRNNSLLDKVYGAIMFGVPNLGMEQCHLAMVEGQPNEIHSRTVKRKEDGSRWDRHGPLAILVNPLSATRRLAQKSTLVFPINEDHSVMAKFPKNHSHVKMVCQKLAEMSKTEKHGLRDSGAEMPSSRDTETCLGGVAGREAHNFPSQATDYGSNDELEVLLESLDVPGLDARESSVEDRFADTFDWIFKLDCFTVWLQDESTDRIFWINGNPGSGKLTLMKFIVRDIRTRQLLHSWKSTAREVHATYFFNYRGSSIEKSFEVGPASTRPALRDAPFNLAKQLLLTGADLNVRDLDGKTTLDLAILRAYRTGNLTALEEQYDLMCELVKCGAEASDYGHYEVSRVLTRFAQAGFQTTTLSANFHHSELHLNVAKAPMAVSQPPMPPTEDGDISASNDTARPRLPAVPTVLYIIGDLGLRLKSTTSLEKIGLD
ncbi:hypothetical protein B0H67DRAFT_640631 [Lasiosphaeris hirsuta]|uniref:Nephrocystin 3-like N-terminal domain-containing protein n=1 Tax=Lasiosphaeris hirsuta TaxID=260670 RepID=A0AA40E3V2_9PEZI|nr:hypothetical protein B0H67DRAFT_640631 [Lasiosphaeris hirsuta]